MKMNNFWQQPPDVQRTLIKTVTLAELEAYAEEHHLLVSNGKLIDPQFYPCTCELQDPEQCFEATKDFPDNEWSKAEVEVYLKAQEDRQCPCPCHRYYEPF